MAKRFLPILILTALAAVWPTKPVLAEDRNGSLFGSDHDPQYDHIKVVRVMAADRIQLETGEKVHLIGLEAVPFHRRVRVERDQYGREIVPEEPTVPVEEQAYNFVSDLLKDKKVRLEFDEQRKDDEMETYAYVFLPDNEMANVLILKQGFAKLSIRPPNMKYVKELRGAYQEARREKRGLQNE